MQPSTRLVVPDFDVAFIDADSFMYSITWGNPSQRACEKMLINTVDEIVNDLEVSKAYIFIKSSDKSNFRYEVDRDYKASRTNRDPEMTERVNNLYEFAREQFIEADRGEADDYCSIYMYQAMAEGKTPIVAHIDKDLNMIPGWHYCTQKGKKRIYMVSPQEAFVFMSKQLLTGDAGDNIPGLKGVGAVTAQKFLNNYKLKEFKDRILEKWDDPRYNTDRERFFKSANCLILRESMDELRPFTDEEILRKMSWSATECRYTRDEGENIDVILSMQADTENEIASVKC